jgi:type II secretory pathway pseudopilin PulG
MVVIGIIGVLTAISVPIVMQSLAKARNAAIKAEIDMLHMAIMNYKNQYGSFPPAISPVTANSLAANHLYRLFPRCPKDATVDANINIPQQLFNAFPTTADPKQINITNALAYWLSGYSPNPSQPLTGNRSKLYSFDMSRVNQVTGAYHPANQPESPYRYLNAALYSSNQYSGGSEGAMRQTYAGDSTPFFNSGSETNEFFNSDTFQILCRGRDGEFGTDDDLSNFWPGTRREFLDSLQ